MTTPKPPTPQGISALLAKAGHTRAVRKMRGGCSGFVVSADYSHWGAVRVRHHFWSMGARPEQAKAKLAAYAKTITDAGWTVEAGEWELTVTARKDKQ